MMNEILIIDDEIEICESIKMILEYEDYEVEYFTDSIKGIEKLKEGQFSVLLLDIQMPTMSGFEVLNEIGSFDSRPNVIMISAHSSLENAVKATKLGAFDFISKPLDLNNLRNIVENALRLDASSEEDPSKLLGHSATMRELREMVERVARSKIPDDALVLVSDADEIPSRRLVQHLKYCEVRALLQLPDLFWRCQLPPSLR